VGRGDKYTPQNPQEKTNRVTPIKNKSYAVRGLREEVEWPHPPKP